MTFSNKIWIAYDHFLLWYQIFYELDNRA